jgi:hypothetical protein
VDGPQRSSANRKSANLRHYQISFIFRPSANATICGFRLADPIFSCNLRIFYLQTHFLRRCSLSKFYSILSNPDINLCNCPEEDGVPQFRIVILIDNHHEHFPVIRGSVRSLLGKIELSAGTLKGYYRLKRKPSNNVKLS